MSNVIITKKGLDFVLSAHNNGPLVWVAYAVPVYDWRIDPTVTEASAFSAIQNENLTTPYGEIIWASDYYDLSDTNEFILSGTGSEVVGANYVNGSRIRNAESINLKRDNDLNYIPISPVYSGSNFVMTSASNNIINWNIADFGTYVGNNNRPYNTCADFFQCSDYYPVYDTSASQRMRGSFKVKFVTDIGRFKFNKVALYATQVNNNTGLPNGNYEFFAEAYLTRPVFKTGLANDGFDHIEMDVQLDLHSVSADWENVFFASSADNWSRTPGGLGALYYPHRVGIGSFEDDVQEVQASLHVRRSRSSSAATYEDIPNLRMDFDRDNYINFKVTEESYDVTEGTKGGDLTITPANWTSYCGDAVSFGPSINRTMTLGKPGYEWRELFLNNDKGYVATINYGEILLGKSLGVWQDSGYHVASIKVAGLQINIENFDSMYGNFKGGDLWREAEELLVFNTYCSNGSLPYNVKDIAIVAGIDLSGTYESVDSQTNVTHKNLVKQLITDEDFSTNLANTAELHIAAKGGIKLHGVLELENNRNDYSTYTHDNAIILTKKNDMFLIGGWDSTYDQVNTDMEDDINFCNHLTPGSRLFLIGRSIRTQGTISPWLDTTDDLGTSTFRYNNVYSKNLNVSLTEDNGEVIFGGAKIYKPAEQSTYLIPYGIGETLSIGTQDSKIYRGWFRNLYVDDLDTNLGYFSKISLKNSYTGEENFIDDISNTSLNGYMSYISPKIITSLPLEIQYIQIGNLTICQFKISFLTNNTISDGELLFETNDPFFLRLSVFDFVNDSDIIGSININTSYYNESGQVFMHFDKVTKKISFILHGVHHINSSKQALNYLDTSNQEPGIRGAGIVIFKQEY